MITELDERSRSIFRQIVDAYVETGEPIGSRTLSRRLGMSMSPATIRNVMADLEDVGLLYAPHTSAGRLPTDMGLRLWVDGLLEVGRLSEDDRSNIDTNVASTGRSVNELLEQATGMLSGLSHCAGLVMAPKQDRPLKHIEFVNLGPGRALVVMVDESGLVENRVVEVPLGVPSSALTEASNYLGTRLVGRTVDEARVEINEELDEHRAQLDELTQRVVETGLATWAGGEQSGSLIVSGRDKLLNDVTALTDLERIRTLFSLLERKETMLRLIQAADEGEGVQIFIGSESALFGLAGCSMIIAPYMNSQERVLGAIGVIGPTRMNYARIIPTVDYTAKVIGRLLG
ncbi:MAG: heat-inducible transcriptional repressor HrcA [Pseudomonadota bacterium]